MASQGAAVSSGPAERYAIALYDHAQEIDRIALIATNMERFGHLIQSTPELAAVIGSPLVEASAARNALRAVIRDQELGVVARRLVDVLITNRRLSLLPAVIVAFRALVASKRGIVTAKVTSAFPLTDVQEQKLRGRLIEAGYGSVQIDQEVDSDLIGGLVVRVGARLYDSSLKSRLQRLQYAMKGAA